MANASCPKCGGTMSDGFVLDEAHAWRTPTKWIEGAPEKSFWTGLKLRGRRQLPIATLRCDRCGLLESYARD